MCVANFDDLICLEYDAHELYRMSLHGYTGGNRLNDTWFWVELPIATAISNLAEMLRSPWTFRFFPRELERDLMSGSVSEKRYLKARNKWPNLEFVDIEKEED